MRTATLQGLLKDGDDPVPTHPIKGLVFCGIKNYRFAFQRKLPPVTNVQEIFHCVGSPFTESAVFLAV